MKEYIFTVNGMACQMCENHINDAVRRNANVISVKSDRKKNSVTIVADSLDTDLITAKIKELGYTVGGVSEQSYEKKSFFSRFKR